MLAMRTRVPRKEDSGLDQDGQIAHRGPRGLEAVDWKGPFASERIIDIDFRFAHPEHDDCVFALDSIEWEHAHECDRQGVPTGLAGQLTPCQILFSGPTKSKLAHRFDG